MSRQHAFDEAALEHLTEQYHDERGDPGAVDPDHASGRCHLASEDFVAWARQRGHSAHLVERMDTPGFRGEHVAAKVHSFVVDPTSAQLPHTGGASYETVPYDPEKHRITKGWYGNNIPDEGAPKHLGKPNWPADKPWDDLPQEHQDRMTKPASWVRWH